MRLRITFTMPNQSIPVNYRHQMNGFIHKALGEGNPYHDTFSKYSVSSIQGGRINKESDMIVFDKFKPFFFVSSVDTVFLSKLVVGLCNKSLSLFGMKVDNIERNDFRPGKTCDRILTMSPIYLIDPSTIKRSTGKRRLTFKDDIWLDTLNTHCLNKLKHLGIEDDTFKIEMAEPEKARIRKIWVKDVYNITSKVFLDVKGKPETRAALYDMGLGGCTGCGFGSVRIVKQR